MRKKLVVIGNGVAGIRTVEELLTAAPEHYQITVFGAEPYGSYNRILLSAVLSGDKTVEEIITHPQAWYVDNGITLHAGVKKTVVKIDRAKRQVIAQDGTVADYNRLLIAIGSKPLLPQVEGIDLAGVIRFRDIFDVNTMLHYCQTHRQAVVLGGGLLGLEAANGLVQQGMAVTVVHNHQNVLNRQMDSTAAQLLQRELERRGVRFNMAAKLQRLLGGEHGQIVAAQLADGRELACDLFVAAIGVYPNIELARAAGLYCERGIVVDDTLQTDDPRIYAVGECIQHHGETFGLVAPLFEQAKVCANQLSGHGTARYATLPTATRLKITGIDVFSVGDFLGDADSESLTLLDETLPVYKKAVLRDGVLVGMVMYGDTRDNAWYLSLLQNKTPITPFREQLLFGRR